MKIGSELRRRRTELGLTLREVADDAGLTSGFLSQVENERVSPSLKSLVRIAEVLKIPPFHLLATGEGNPVMRASERPLVPFQDKGEHVSLLTPFRNWKLLPFHRVFGPGEHSPAVRLDRAREEWMLVQSGTIEIRLSPDERHVLNEGDAIHFESSRLLEVNNLTDEPAETIFIMTPPAI